ncbi:Uncharacterised protein [Vibrio cholerae]|nr:Uncharacterised protein [Vibrio cholerae]CSD41235.1 Uncharacterised protein [Vibrio cholerae]
MLEIIPFHVFICSLAAPADSLPICLIKALIASLPSFPLDDISSSSSLVNPRPLFIPSSLLDLIR